MTMDNTPLSF